MQQSSSKVRNSRTANDAYEIIEMGGGVRELLLREDLALAGEVIAPEDLIHLSRETNSSRVRGAVLRANASRGAFPKTPAPPFHWATAKNLAKIMFGGWLLGASVFPLFSWAEAPVTGIETSRRPRLVRGVPALITRDMIEQQFGEAATAPSATGLVTGTQSVYSREVAVFSEPLPVPNTEKEESVLLPVTPLIWQGAFLAPKIEALTEPATEADDTGVPEPPAPLPSLAPAAPTNLRILPEEQ